jgi:phosphoribosylglycinamide formyltransferase-1
LTDAATQGARLAVLVSGAGTNLQALLDACRDPRYGADVVGVGADRAGTPAVARAAAAAVETFESPLAAFPERSAWDRDLAERVDAWKPDLVVLAGFMKLVGPAFLERFGGRCVNTHPALLPAFPGMHAVRDALAYGAKITGATLFVVDSGVDEGPVLAQTAVAVHPDDDESTLHERIKQAERAMLVETVGRMAREGFTIEGRRVSIP